MEEKHENEPLLLNPNCSECIWRLKGSSQRYEGSNQEPIADFILDILKIFVEKGWGVEKALSAEPIYISGDGGPDTLEYAFIYAYDLVRGKRDPIELSHPGFDDAIWSYGYTWRESDNWEPLVVDPSKETDETRRAKELLQQLHQNSEKKPRKRKTVKKP